MAVNVLKLMYIIDILIHVSSSVCILIFKCAKRLLQITLSVHTTVCYKSLLAERVLLFISTCSEGTYVRLIMNDLFF